MPRQMENVVTLRADDGLYADLRDWADRQGIVGSGVAARALIRLGLNGSGEEAFAAALEVARSEEHQKMTEKMQDAFRFLTGE